MQSYREPYSDDAKSMPLWVAIADTLTKEITEGRYEAGMPLPTEAALSERFGVNRHTVRRSLAALAEAGFVRTRRGAGTYVLPRPTDYPIGRRVRYHKNLLAVGQTPARKVLKVEEGLAPHMVAKRLKITHTSQVCTAFGVYMSDGVPIGLYKSHFPAGRFVGIAAVLNENHSVTKVLRQFGVDDFTRSYTRVSACAADAEQAGLLVIEEGTPLLMGETVNVDPQGRPVEYGTTWFISDRVSFTFDERAY